MSKRKYTKEFKLKVLKEHEEGASFYSLEKKYGITLGTVKRWNSAYRAHGEDVLAPQNSNLCRYTAEFKKKVVLDHNSCSINFKLKFEISFVQRKLLFNIIRKDFFLFSIV